MRTIFIFVSSIIFFLGSHAQEFTLEVSVKGIKDIKGDLLISLYNDPSSFPKAEGSLKKSMLNVKNNEESFLFQGLDQGSYAFAIFQDLNGNKILDADSNGIPLEPFTFSKDAMGKGRPPTWDEACIQLNNNTSESVKLKDLSKLRNLINKLQADDKKNKKGS